MPASNVKVADECMVARNKIWKGEFKYMVMKLVEQKDDGVVELEDFPEDPEAAKSSEEKRWDSFVDQLSKQGARFVVYDVHYQAEGVRKKMLFIHWNPDEASRKDKVLYASAVEDVKAILGFTKHLQASSASDLEWSAILNKVMT